MQVKHHQWAIFARRHLEMLLNEKAVASAKATFLRRQSISINTNRSLHLSKKGPQCSNESDMQC
eukprot:4766511-Amphidinium_carterae.1